MRRRRRGSCCEPEGSWPVPTPTSPAAVKYERSSVDTNRARSRQSLLEWALFNLLTGNSDAHLKNVSFLVGPDGIRIAPFYDLVSTQSYNTVPGHAASWPDAELTMPIGKARTFADVEQAAFAEFARALGVAPTAYRRTLKTFVEKIEACADQIYAEFETLAIPEPVMREGELKVLRAIRSIIIKEMVGKLRAVPKPRKKKGG